MTHRLQVFNRCSFRVGEMVIGRSLKKANAHSQVLRQYDRFQRLRLRDVESAFFHTDHLTLFQDVSALQQTGFREGGGDADHAEEQWEVPAQANGPRESGRDREHTDLEYLNQLWRSAALQHIKEVCLGERECR